VANNRTATSHFIYPEKLPDAVWALGKEARMDDSADARKILLTVPQIFRLEIF